MLAIGLILLVLGVILALALPQVREIGAVSAVGGVVLIILSFLM